MEIVRVWKNKKANQKLATIPAKSKIKEGDYIQIKVIKKNKGV